MLRRGIDYRFMKSLGRRVVADDMEALGIPANDFLAARYVDEIVHDLILMDII